MIVGLCKLTLHFPSVHSLKEKRKLLHKIKDRTASCFHVPIAEVGEQELWQKSLLGFAVVGNGQVDLEAIIQKIHRFIEEMQVGEIIACEKEIIHF